MRAKYSVSNFRTFDNEGADFHLFPLTILTGCNSSGKSSMVKSLLVLESFLADLRRGMAEGDCCPFLYSLDFYEKNVQLGRFDLALNDKAAADDPMVFAYQPDAEGAEDPWTVQYSFVKNENDALVQGRLSEIKLLDGEEVVLELTADQGIFQGIPFRLDKKVDLFRQIAAAASKEKPEKLDQTLFLMKQAMAIGELAHVSYLGSSKAEVKRLYSMSDTSNSFDELLIRYVNTRRDYDEASFLPGSFINRWIHEFGIGDSITFKNTEEGLGLLVLLHKDADDHDGHLLADEGYGITQLLATLINVEMAIMSQAQGHMTPTITVEEPEIHLHPKYQSILADMFFEAYQNYGIEFIIETHSEYLVRKTQVIVNQLKGKNNPFKVYYFEPGCRPRDLVYQSSGRFLHEFGPGFFDVSKDLVYKLI